MIENTFTAIDFETATGYPSSICQVGLVRIEEGQIIKKIDQLIHPPGNHFLPKNIEIHGIKPAETREAPTFDVFWPEMSQYIEDQVVVAHNSGFDINCLRSTLDYYGLEQPTLEERCTRTIYRKGLAYLSKKYKIDLNHHHALSDAHACAQLYLKFVIREALPKTGRLF